MGYDPHQPQGGYSHGFQPAGKEGDETPPPPPPSVPGGYEPTQYAGPTQYGSPYVTPPPPPVYPEVASVPPSVGRYGIPSVQPPRQSLRWLWITLAIIAGVIVLACGGCALVGFIAALKTNADSTVNDYYSAIKQQDYQQAYSYLLTDTLTIQGKRISVTQGSFVLIAQALDQQNGPVTSYSITSSSTIGGTATVVVHVTRSSGLAYDVYLQLTQIDNEWKITQLDNI
ncbi:MAG: DUF4878 domain-containing protein [Thermogemmatispora sp.]|uniref:DUF4878 domain-containing protein n=1 Tax=Thermogemmatispora sp. TaxID=1968838 RepID=UPI00261B451E|nr:DUF4878 domain-containing protein [Thermogemmatispora sp.]MBX5458724.1 DUF4878 domain-containing protein [Thermogemmatispora sp.]